MHAPRGSEPGYRRPVIVVQGDALNRTSIATVLCVPTTTNLILQQARGNVLLSASATGLPKQSVANVSQLIAINKSRLVERVGQLSKRHLDLVFGGLDIVLGRSPEGNL